MDRQMHGWVDRWIDRHILGWKDVQIEREIIGYIDVRSITAWILVCFSWQ